MNTYMTKKRRDELHRLWVDVTGTATAEIHRADGYKGTFVAEQGYELIRPHYLQSEALKRSDGKKR